LRKFSVAPELSKARVSALFADECMKVHNVIDFLADINTFSSVLHLIKAEMIKWMKNPLLIETSLKDVLGLPETYVIGPF
jgi:hypothetical protein